MVIKRPSWLTDDILWFIVVVIFFIIGFWLGNIYGANIASSSVNEKYQQTLDEYFQNLYSSNIQEKGAKIINSMVNESSKYENKTEKLNKIADLIKENFTNPYWTDTQFQFYPIENSNNTRFNYHFFGNFTRYGYNKQGNVRSTGTNLTHDPYWIAYQQTGACGELADLFANVSNKSGFESRAVYSPDPDHAWTEVLINGEWWYFDSDMYHLKNGEREYQNDWFNNKRINLEKKLGWNFGKIYIFNKTPDGLEEDITSNYTTTGKLVFFIKNPIDRILITQAESNRKTIIWKQNVSCSIYPCEIVTNIGGENTYKILVENNLNLLGVYQFEISEVKILSGKTFYVNICSPPIRFNRSEIIFPIYPVDQFFSKKPLTI